MEQAKNLCWELTDFANQNLGYDTLKPKKALLRPRITEKVVLHHPLTFPLKEMYEYMNTTLEGLREKDRLHGEPFHLDELGDDDDDDDDSKPDDDGKPDQRELGGEGGSRIQELIDRINDPAYDKYRNAVDDDDNTPSILDEVPDPHSLDADNKADGPEPSSSDGKKLESHLKGKPGDNVIYEDQWGDPCKIDSKGRTYKVGEDGRRLLKPSLRPKEISPEDWQRMPIADRERLKVKEKKIRDAKAAEERAARLLREAKRKAEAEEKENEGNTQVGSTLEM